MVRQQGYHNDYRKEGSMDESKIVEVAKLPGVKDLPVQVRWRFAKALIAEREGNTTLAEVELHRAVEAEADLSTPAPVA
jgi:hypothetical protein